jgi:hypothetical protein
MFTEIFLTRNEVADEAGRSYDTVRRAEKAGRLPNTRVASNGGKEMRLDDLVAAELIDPVAAAGIYEARTAASRGRPAPPPAATRAERDVGNLARDLAVANERIDGLVEMLRRADREIAFHRGVALTAEAS